MCGVWEMCKNFLPRNKKFGKIVFLPPPQDVRAKEENSISNVIGKVFASHLRLIGLVVGMPNQVTITRKSVIWRPQKAML
jgi:hypothetical protein